MSRDTSMGRGIFRSALKSPEDGRRALAARKLNPRRVRGRFDSADYFTKRDQSDIDAAIRASKAHAAGTASVPSPARELNSDTSSALYNSPATASDDSAQVHSSPATQFTEGTLFPYPESDESSDDARRKVAARHINPNRRLRRFDSADYFSERAQRPRVSSGARVDAGRQVQKAATHSSEVAAAAFGPYESDESSDDVRKKVAARHINPNRRLRRFDSADFFSERAQKPRVSGGAQRPRVSGGARVDDGRKRLLEHKLNPSRRLRRFDSADFFSRQDKQSESDESSDAATSAKSAAKTSLPAYFNGKITDHVSGKTTESADDAWDMISEKYPAGIVPDALTRFDSADYFKNKQLKNKPRGSQRTNDATDLFGAGGMFNGEEDSPNTDPFATAKTDTTPTSMLRKKQKKKGGFLNLTINSKSPPMSKQTLRNMNSPRPNETRVGRKLLRGDFHSADMLMARKARQQSTASAAAATAPAGHSTFTSPTVEVPPADDDPFEEAMQSYAKQRALRKKLPRSPSDRPGHKFFSKRITETVANEAPAPAPAPVAAPAPAPAPAAAVSSAPTRTTPKRVLKLRQAALYKRLGATGKSLM